jgi:hypothetical protein
MEKATPAEPRVFQVGDLVEIRYSGYKRARIVELRGPLGPGGAQVYRVRVRQKPRPAYIEVLADQLVPAAPAPRKPQPPTNE